MGRLPIESTLSTLLIDQAQPRRVYALHDTTVYRSDDAGQSWQAAGLAGCSVVRQPEAGRSTPVVLPALHAEEITYFKSLWSVEHRMFQREQNQRPQAPMTGGGP